MADAEGGRLIGLADDHPIVRAALKAALSSLGPRIEFVEAGDAAAALALASSRPDLDLLLIDLAMPGCEGVSTIRAIRAQVPELPVAVVSASEDAATVEALLALGVNGFIPKTDSPSVIVDAVRLILDGGTYVPARLIQARAERVRDEAGAGAELGLTPRQWEVLRLLGEAKSNKVIARELGITEGTVKVHLLAVFRALNVRNRTAAVIAARRYGQ